MRPIFSRVLRHYFEGQTIIVIADGAPEGDGAEVVDQNAYGEPFVLRPHLGAQQFDDRATNAATTVFSNDKKLPQIDLLLVLAKEGISDDGIWFLHEHSAIFAGEPCVHALLQLWHGHAVSMPLIANQLMVQFREQVRVVQGGKAKVHAAFQQSGPL